MVTAAEWWNERIGAAMKGKNEAWREWFKDRSEEKREKWKRLAKVTGKIIKIAKVKTWEVFTDILQNNYKENKTKPREMLDRN